MSMQRYLFVRRHLFQMHRDFFDFQRDILTFLRAMEDFLQTVLPSDEKSEIERDIRIYSSRMVRLANKLQKLNDYVNNSEPLLNGSLGGFNVTQSIEIVDKMTEELLKWRDAKKDLSDNFLATTRKWGSFRIGDVVQE